MAPDVGPPRSHADRLRQLIERFRKDRARQAESEILTDEGPFDYRISPLCYPGLRSFAPAEDGFFYGRQRNVGEIRKKLAAERIVVVQGGSGTGKSSVIRAGLFPRLRDSESMTGRNGNWYWAEFRPRTDPLGNLAEGLAQVVGQWFPGQSADPIEPAAGESLSASDLEARVKSRLDLAFRNAANAEDSDGEAASQRTTRAQSVLAVLRDFVAEVDARDLLATNGLRAGPANLLLLVDQFEEVFRPEVEESGTYLLDLLIAAHVFLKQTPAGKFSGLFIVVTMRTEELYRAGEHPALQLPPDWLTDGRGSVSLSDVINDSFYLIQLLDPEQDRDDLRAAVIKPAMKVLEEYELTDHFETADTPFADGVVQWLLDGMKAWGGRDRIKHKADQLPLLQHALRAIWETALERWSLSLLDGSAAPLRIEKTDLPGQTASDLAGQGARLENCLDYQAGKAKDAAVEAFAIETAGGMGVPAAAHDGGVAAIRAAVRALARRDDRGNWTRRFASIAEIDAFANVDPDTAHLEADIRRAGISSALRSLTSRTYVSRGPEDQYDISHEALIRNWRQAQDWLHEPTDVTLAIERILTDVNPALLDQPNRAAEIEDLIPRQLADRLSPITELPARVDDKDQFVRLPHLWAMEQIRSLIGSEGSPLGWGSVESTFDRIRKLCEVANAERQRQLDEQKRRNRQSERYRRRLKWLAGSIGVAVISTSAVLVTLNAEQQAAANYEAAKNAADTLVSSIVLQLRNKKDISGDVLDTIFDVANELLAQIQANVEKPEFLATRRLMAAVHKVEALLTGKSGQNDEEEALQQSKARMLYEFAQTYNKSAKDPSRSLSLAIESLAIWEHLIQTGYPSPETRVGYALAEMLLGDLTRQRIQAVDRTAKATTAASSNLDVPRKHLEEARRVLASLSDSFATHADRALDYSQVLTKLGDLDIIDGNLEEAERIYQAAQINTMNVFRKTQPLHLAVYVPTQDYRYGNVVREVAWTYRKIGDVQSARQHFRDAIHSYGNEVCVRRYLTRLDGSNRLWAQDLGFALTKLGDALLHREPPDMDAARAAYGEALHVRLLLAEASGSNPFERTSFATALRKMADLMQAERDTGLAELFKKAAGDIQPQVPSQAAAPIDQTAQATDVWDKVDSAAQLAVLRYDAEFTRLKPAGNDEDAVACWDNLVRSIEDGAAAADGRR